MERRLEMAHPAPLAKAEPLHCHTQSLRCSTVLYNSLRYPTHSAKYFGCCTVRRSAWGIRGYWLRLVTLRTVSVLYVRFLYTVWRHITLTHAMSWYVTLPHTVYGVCTPSRCVCTQFCGVRHPNVSISEPRMKRSWIGVFFLLPCWPSPSSICSVALRLLHHCRRPLWVVLSRLFLQHGCGTVTRTSNAVEGLAATYSWQSIDEFLLWNLVIWQKRRESKRKKLQSTDIWRRNSRFLICWGLGKEKEKQKKSRKEADIKTKFPISYFGRACPK